MKKIGLLLPAYNEEKNIGTVLKEAKRYFPRAKIVVVDDGSKDRTFEISSKMGITVIRHSTNLGKGAALSTGFEYFNKNPVDFIIIVDADRQYRIVDALKFIEAFEKDMGDVIIGYRRPGDMPFANRAGNFIWRTLFNLLFGTRFKDTNCGFIGINRNGLKKVTNLERGYNIENSIIIECLDKKLRVFQVPVRVFYRKRKVSKFAKMFFTVLIFILINGLKYRIRGKF